jgi:hypothetical protein
MNFLIAGPKQNRPQVKSSPSQISPSQIGPNQIGPKSNRPKLNRPQIKSLYYYVFLFNLIICIVNCVVYLIPNQIIVLLCCLFNLIICPLCTGFYINSLFFIIDYLFLNHIPYILHKVIFTIYVFCLI